jgi:methylaspartate mutase sigma subunit
VSQPKPMIVIGTIGGDSHVVGVKLLGELLRTAGYGVTNLGAMVPPADFVKAAIETNAQIIMVSSLSGNAEYYCRDLRGMCDEAGLDRVILYVGGNITVGHAQWKEVEKRFLDMGFNRAFPPQSKGPVVLDALAADLAAATS